MASSTSWDPLEHLVSVTVAAVGDRDVDVRLADGRPGVIASKEFVAEGLPAVGDTVQAIKLTRDDPRGRAVLSREVARKQLAWRAMEAARAADEPVRGVVISATKGGFIVDVGVRAFMPSSLSDRSKGGADVIGAEIEVLVIDLDHDTERLVVSRRDLVRKNQSEHRAEVMSTLQLGAAVTARVTRVADFGLVVDIDGVQALVPRGELDWDPRRAPSAMAKEGDEISAVVHNVSDSRGRVRLSMKRRAPDPLGAISAGDRVAGRVARIVDYGAFIELLEEGVEEGIVGLCHVSELSDDRFARPDELVVPGEEVMVKVLAVDRRKRRVSLSVTQGMWG